MLRILVVVVIAIVGTAQAFSSPDCIPLAFANYMSLLDPLADEDLTAMVNKMSDMESQALTEAIGNHTHRFCHAVDELVTASSRNAKRGYALHNKVLNDLPYFHGVSVWDNYISLAFAVPNLLYGSDGSPYWTETGDWNTECALSITQQALKLAEDALDATCGGDAPCVVKSILEIAGMIIDDIVDAIGLQDTMIHEVNNAEVWLSSEVIFDAVKCQQPVNMLRKHGCNGQNDNCDEGLEIDECAEDIVPPDFFYAPATQTSWFNNAESAGEAVSLMVSAADDCHEVSYAWPVINSACSSSTATVAATDSCGNTGYAVVPILYDNIAPHITCGVTTHTLIAGSAYTNVGFYYQAGDNCGAPTVNTWVTYDEPQDETTNPCIMGHDQTGKITQIYLNGIISAGSDGRVYVINAQAVDAAGNIALCQSTVNVNPSSGHTAVNSGQQFYSTCM